MHIVLVERGKMPALAYGGTERVVWYLAAELVKRGHRVTLLCGAGSSCPFAAVKVLSDDIPVAAQLPDDADLVHLHFPTEEAFPVPYLITNHGNRGDKQPFACNTVFVSNNHAQRYGADAWVHNGLDWNDYGKPDLNNKRTYVHFLGNAAWRVKNVLGAIQVSKAAGKKLVVMGGNRLNLKMGFRLTLDAHVRFKGMVGGDEKLSILAGSAGLLFPVRWHEPFGLAVIESLYFGCPVFGTPYGSLPELVDQDCGFLSNDTASLARELANSEQFSRKYCHERAADLFNATRMADDYLKLYEKVMQGEILNNKAPVLQDENVPRFLEWKS